VVEDNELNRRLLARQMERLGCPVETADDGETALARLREREFGLVLMDCQMPRLDGLETARRLRAFEGGRRRVPIVAISANSTAEDRQACLDAGMDDFVSKPATAAKASSAAPRARRAATWTRCCASSRPSSSARRRPRRGGPPRETAARAAPGLRAAGRRLGV
jgi:CheY-like chemotaxis protein